MKPYYLLALLALLILAACLAACRQEPAVTTVTTPLPTPTTVSATSTPHRTSISYPDVSGSLPSTEMTTPIVPVISTAVPTTSTRIPTPTTVVPTDTAAPVTTATPVIVTTTTKPKETLPPEPINNPWTVTCNEYISLRQRPSTASRVMTTIPVGEIVDVLEFVNGEFAKVRWNRKTGYVMSAYLTRSPEIGSSLDLTVVKPVQNYSYEQMQADLATLAQRYPDLVTLSSIGKSEEGRDLTLCILGNPDAQRRIFIQASIHGREHIVTLLALSEIDYLLSHQDMVLEDGSTVKDLLKSVAIHIVPMSNPDGVTISQTGKLPEKFVKIYGNSTFYATQWKANANGIDLNGNFDADWKDYESIYESSSPAFAGYKGTAPECAAESKALAEYLRANPFDLILSYHTSGSLIYWSYDYKELPEVNHKCYDIASRLADYTGYILGEQETSSTAGLKDYAIQSLKTPSLTMEFAIADSPAPISEFEQIWVRGKHTMLISAQWALEQNTAE